MVEKNRIIEIQEKIEELRAALPAHSIRPGMMMDLEDLEVELEQLLQAVEEDADASA
jgi:hypothetical protein